MANRVHPVQPQFGIHNLKRTEVTPDESVWPSPETRYRSKVSGQRLGSSSGIQIVHFKSKVVLPLGISGPFLPGRFVGWLLLS